VRLGRVDAEKAKVLAIDADRVAVDDTCRTNHIGAIPGRFPLVECRIGIAGEDLSSVAVLVNGEALALKQAADALQRQRLFARRAIGEASTPEEAVAPFAAFAEASG
jgi:hypothetical protein